VKPGPEFVGSLGGVVGLLIFLLSYPSAIFVFLYRNDWKTFLDLPAQREKTEMMYKNIAGYRPMAKYYYPLFMIRRFVFILIPVVFAGLSTIQI
jgi:hypothetical protein